MTGSRAERMAANEAENVPRKITKTERLDFVHNN